MNSRHVSLTFRLVTFVLNISNTPCAHSRVRAASYSFQLAQGRVIKYQRRDNKCEVACKYFYIIVGALKTASGVL